MADDSGRITELIAAAGVPLAGAVIKDARPGSYYFAIVSIVRDEEGRQEPSARRLEEVRAGLLELGFSVEFVSTDPLSVDIEAGLRAALTSSYGESVGSVAIALYARRATVWVELADAVGTQTFEEAVEAKVRLYFASFGITELTIVVASRANLPSVTVCLRAIRQLAPATSEALRARLTTLGFEVPSEEWLAHRLDAMRRSGRIVRRRDGSYVLTADALQRLGTNKLRTSPDVIRLLALARRAR